MAVPVLMAVGLAAFTGALCPADSDPTRFVADLRSGERRTLVLYGTSLTHLGAWPEIVAERLAEDFDGRSRVVNAAQSGMHSEWGVANFAERVLAAEPDAVIMEFGINDAYSAYGISPAAALDNVRIMARRLRAARPHCELILMTTNPALGEHRARRGPVKNYYAGYRRLAAEQGWRIIDLEPRWETALAGGTAARERYLPDDLHPSPLAARDLVAPAVLAALYGQKKPK